MFLSMDVPPSGLKQPVQDWLFMPVVAVTSDSTHCIAVALPTVAHHIATRVILLPGFGPQAGEAFRRVHASWANSQQYIRIAADIIPPEQRLGDPRFATYGRGWWQMLCRRLNEGRPQPPPP